MMVSVPRIVLECSVALTTPHHTKHAGHSLGGGTAALVAMLLRHDARLPRRTAMRLRAVCLAPAAVLGRNLAWGCQHYVATIIYREHVWLIDWLIGWFIHSFIHSFIHLLSD
jgi:hypothetical protein